MIGAAQNRLRDGQAVITIVTSAVRMSALIGSRCFKWCFAMGTIISSKQIVCQRAVINWTVTLRLF
jgi:hypothetical protein